MKVLGIDPGTVAMGYGMVDDSDGQPVMVECGVLNASSKDPIAHRLFILFSGLTKLLARLRPTEVAVEEPFVATNVRSALAVGQAQAVALLAAAQQGLPTYNYTPAQVKQSVASYGRSGKEQVQEMVRLQLGLESVPRPDDAADALAVALCHWHQTRLSRLLKQEET